MEGARKLVEQGREYWDKAVAGNDSLRVFQEQAFAAASEALRATRLEVARMEAAAAEQIEEAKISGQWLGQEAKKSEDKFFCTLKGGVFYALEHRTESVAAAGIVLVLALPATHKFIYRRTIGRFRSPEGLVESAEQRLENMKRTLEVLRNDASKLQERAQLAEQELISGRSKLRATAAEVSRSWSTVQKEQTKAEGLKELLKELPARDSVRLRSELANLRHDLRQQAVLLDRQAMRISRLGITG